MAENSANMWPRIRQEKRNVAENSANVAENSAREKEIVAENSANVAKVSAREKEMWLRFQQISGVANLISKHDRGAKLVLHG